jgi:hypothetical protein
MFYRSILTGLLFCIYTSYAFSDNLWSDVPPDSFLQSRPNSNLSLPDIYRLQKLDEAGMRIKLAVINNTSARNSAVNQTSQIEIPLPDETFISLKVKEISTMAPELAEKYPQIKTYSAEGKDNNGIYGTLDFTHQGFHSMLFMKDGSRLFIDPRKINNNRVYIVYFDKHYHPSGKKPFKCDIKSHNHLESENSISNRIAQRSGNKLKTYRLAMATTGEYTAFHGGTVENSLSAITTTVSRINGIYLRDLAIKLELVANNDLLIQTDTTTYADNDGFSMLEQNQIELDRLIGTVNYDIGHVMGTGSGGVAYLGGACDNTSKAQGVTGNSQPINDTFDIDYVAHEIGHQFGGNHSFNSTLGSCSGNGNAATAFEPGSGSTIMAYAGICESDNVQKHSDAMFHIKSIDQISNFINSSSCGTESTINNKQPVAKAGGDFIIPTDTPFELSGSATDPDADTLSYSWEQVDAGSFSDIDVDTSDNALFRSFLPQSKSTRIFPTLSSILSNTVSQGETLPTTNRKLNFSLAVRDGKGGVASDQMLITVNDSNPFRITSHNAIETITGNTTVTWDVANTNTAPVSCNNVNILLSTNSGNTFSNISTGTPNDGNESITIPSNIAESTKARFKVKCSNNIFFDISDADLTIQLPTATDADNDGFTDNIDNCPAQSNPRQSDENNDGQGDLCTPYQLPNNQWHQISMPADVNNATVADIFSDDLPAASYGDVWVLYSLDPITLIQSKLTLSDVIKQGIGYWIIQETGNTINIDLPANVKETSIQQSSQCSSTSGCYEIIISAASEDKINLLGYPFEHSLSSLQGVRIVSASGGCAEGCTLNEAAEAKIYHKDFITYNGIAYEDLNTTTGISSWTGMWGKTMENANGLEVRILFPLP